MTKKEVMELEKKKKTELDFEKDVSINKFKLDEECLSHPGLYYNYGEAQAIAKTEVARTKDNLELVEAERREAIRIELENKGIKPTIPMLDSAVIRDEEVREAKLRVREAEDIYNKLTIALQAMDARRSELDNLVKLYLAGYFSTPNSNGAKNGVIEQTEKSVRSNLNKNK